MFTFEPTTRPPLWSYIQFGDEADKVPCTWTADGEAHDEAPRWKVEAATIRPVGVTEQVRLSTPLGVYVGEMQVVRAEAWPATDVQTVLVNRSAMKAEEVTP